MSWWLPVNQKGEEENLYNNANGIKQDDGDDLNNDDGDDVDPNIFWAILHEERNTVSMLETRTEQIIDEGNKKECDENKPDQMMRHPIAELI